MKKKTTVLMSVASIVLATSLSSTLVKAESTNNELNDELNEAVTESAIADEVPESLTEAEALDSELDALLGDQESLQNQAEDEFSTERFRRPHPRHPGHPRHPVYPRPRHPGHPHHPPHYRSGYPRPYPGYPGGGYYRHPVTCYASSPYFGTSYYARAFNAWTAQNEALRVCNAYTGDACIARGCTR